MADPLSIAASVAGLLSLAGATISKGYSIVSSVRSFPKDVEQLLREAAALNYLISQLISSATGPRNMALGALKKYGTLQDCEETIKALDGILAKCLPKDKQAFRNATMQMIWPLRTQDVQKLLSRFQRLQGTLQTALSVDSV